MRTQTAKMCIYVEEIFSNDMIRCKYDISEGITIIGIDCPLSKNIFVFSFILLDVSDRTYRNLTQRLEKEIRAFIKREASKYGY